MTYPEDITVKSADLANVISLFEARAGHFEWCDFRQRGSISVAEGVKPDPCNCGYEQAKTTVEEFYQRTLGDASRASRSNPSHD